MGDMSGEYAGHARTGMFSASRNCVQILATRAVHYHAATWGDSRGWMAQQWPSGSRHGISVHSKYTAHPHNAMHAVCHLPCIVKTVDSSVKRTPLQSARRHRMWAFAHTSRLQRRTAVRSRPRWGRRACRWGSLRRFLTVCAEILWLCKPIVAAALRVAGLRRSWRWRCWMWRSWAGVVTRGLRLWGRLDVLPNSLKRLWRRLMVEKWTFNSRATALVDTPAVSMPIARSLKTCDICDIVLCDKTAHFRVAFWPAWDTPVQ